jgi:hypothetical protein
MSSENEIEKNQTCFPVVAAAAAKGSEGRKNVQTSFQNQCMCGRGGCLQKDWIF